MKHASELMYKIGRIFNFVLFGIYGIWAIFAIVAIATGAAAQSSEAVAAGVYSLIWAILFLAFTLVALILSKKALNALEDGRNNKKEHIIMIVVGAISNDIFYLLGGIFGLIAEGQQANQQPAEEQPKEEEKKDEE